MQKCMMRLSLSENSFLFKRGYAFYHENGTFVLILFFGRIIDVNRDNDYWAIRKWKNYIGQICRRSARLPLLWCGRLYLGEKILKNHILLCIVMKKRLADWAIDILPYEYFVMAGSMSSFHYAFDDKFEMMVFLYVEPDNSCTAST